MQSMTEKRPDREQMESQSGPMSYDEREALEAAGFSPDQMTSAECADAYAALKKADA